MAEPGMPITILLLCVVTVVGVASGCPARYCRCIQKGSSLFTACVSSNLTNIPSSIPSNTEELYIKGNNIRTLQQGAFSHLGQLKTLILSNSNLESIEPNAFSGLNNLGTLDLRWNKIRELQSYTFSGLGHLKRLVLDNNEIEIIHNFALHGLNLSYLGLENNKAMREISIKGFHGARVEELYLYNVSLSSQSSEALKPLQGSLKQLFWENNNRPLALLEDLFKDFRFTSINLNGNGITDTRFLGHVLTDDLSLEHNPVGPIDFSQYPNFRQVRNLHLSNTSFNTVEGKYFAGMTHLAQLHLANNDITTLPESLWNIFTRLHRLGLNDNPLHCNCELVWFKHWLEMAIERGVRDVEAKCYTPSQKNFEDIFEEHMRCVPPTLVEITRSVNVSQSMDVTLTCTASGDPAPNIVWSNPGGGVFVTSTPSDRSVRRNTGVLHLKYTSNDDAGVYKCYAHNMAGNISSTVDVGIYEVYSSRAAGITHRNYWHLVVYLLGLSSLYLFTCFH